MFCRLTLASIGAEPDKVEVPAVQDHDGLSGRLVEAVGRGSEGANGHEPNLQIRWTTG